MLNAQTAVYKAFTKAICGDPHNNGIPDGTIVTGHLYHDVGAYKIKVFDFGRSDYTSYEVDPDTVGVFTGLRLDNEHDESMVFVNDEVLDLYNGNSGIVIYDETNYCFAVKTVNNGIIPFTKWNWHDTRITSYKPTASKKIDLEDVSIFDEQLNLITPVGAFRAHAYNDDNEYVGIDVDFVPNNNEPASTVKFELVGETGRLRVLMYDKDDNNEDYVAEYSFGMFT